MKLLIPLDGSKFSEAVLEPVTRLVDLKWGQVEVHLLKVVNLKEAHFTYVKPPPLPDDIRYPPYVTVARQYDTRLPATWGVQVLETQDQALERMTVAARDYLVGVASHYFPGVGRPVVILGKDPAHEIEEYARREGVHLIALATHGRTGLAEMLMGGVAARLLHSRVAPVFLVRPAGLGQEHHREAVGKRSA